MEEEKIDRILKLVDMLEVTDENRDDIAKVKKLIEQKKYAEMLEVLKKVTSKNETKIKEDNRTILFRNEEKEETYNTAYLTYNDLRAVRLRSDGGAED